MRKIAFNDKDNDKNITLQFYFSKLEQILLKYNLSLEDEKIWRDIMYELYI